MSIAEFYIDYGIYPNEDVCEALRRQGHLPDYGTREVAPPVTPSGTKRKGKKRKAESPDGRTCSECSETKTPASFSKNQRRKGSKARCIDCVQRN
jgi:hypothetical protein